MGVGVTMAIEWKGNMRFVRDIIERADPIQIQRNVLMPWRRWVLDWRIPAMYRAKGVVPSEQPRWAKLSEWTYAQKGSAKNLLMLSARQFSGDTMVRAYEIRWQNAGGNNFETRLRNAAKSRSKWSKGYAYPSALHTGWGPYTVKPRADGPGILMIPFLGSFRAIKTYTGEQRMAKSGKATRVMVDTGKKEFHAGRAKAGTKGRGYDTMTMFRAETHPTGAPPRPHIKFYRMDALELAQRVIDWCMDRKTHGAERTAA